MIKLKWFLMSLAVGYSVTSGAAEIGAAHNRYLDCLRRSFSMPQSSIHVLLKTLISRCHYEPPLRSGDEFLKLYADLGEQILRDSLREGLEKAIAPYITQFNDVHLAYLQEIENIVKNQPSLEAAHSLDMLYRKAVKELCPQSLSAVCANPDIAVLAGIDIGASSSRYWKDYSPLLKVKWWHIVLGDVAGGIVGGLFGGGVGAVGLGSACSAAVAGAE